MKNAPQMGDEHIAADLLGPDNQWIPITFVELDWIILKQEPNKETFYSNPLQNKVMKKGASRVGLDVRCPNMWYDFLTLWPKFSMTEPELEPDF